MRARRVLLIPVAAAAAIAGGVVATQEEDEGRPVPRAALSPRELLLESAKAIGRVDSYRLSGVSVTKDDRSHYEGETTADGRMRATYRDKDGTLSVIAIGRATWLKGDQRYWRKVGGAAARSSRVLSGRWVKLPPSAGSPLREDVLRLLPERQAYCLPKNLGTLSLDGTRIWKGRKVIVLRDAGDQPGTTPSELWIAATGPAVPLRELQHGRQKPGGVFDGLCDDRDEDTLRSSTSIDGYDAVAPIVPPKNPLDPGALPPAPGGLRA